MKPNQTHPEGWRIKGLFQWSVAMASFVLFLLLEGCLLYAYYVYLSAH